MKKFLFKALYLLLVLAFFASIMSTPAMAIDKLNASNIDLSLEQDVIPEAQFDTSAYDRMTISFTTTPESYNIDSGSNEYKSDNIAAAKDYVISLNLDKQGYQYIRDACLAQLQDLENNRQVLLSYSVLVPKTRAISPTYYGTVGNIDYYYAWYSSYTTEGKSQTISNLSQKWASGVVDLILQMLNVSIPIQFSIFKTLIGLPVGYEIKSEAYVENYFVVEANCRGIFTYDTVHAGAYYPYMLWFSAEEGTARPSCIYHPLDLSLPYNSYEYTGNAEAVATNNFYDDDWQLFNASTCWDTGVPIYQRLNQVLPTYYWG